MKPEELSAYIGEIDDDLIEGAKKKRSVHKKVIMIAGSIAACAVLAVTGVFLTTRRKLTEVDFPFTGSYTEQGGQPSTGFVAGGETSEAIRTEVSGDNAIEIIDSKIYYVQDGKLLSKTETHEARPEVVFDLWKQMNHIGDEIGFVSVNIDDNGWAEESEVDGQGVGTYHVGDHFVYRLMISQPLDDYYGKIDKELLLESLKQTMLDAAGMKIDEYELACLE